MFSNLSGQGKLSQFKDQLPRDIFYSIDFMEKVENQIEKDLKLSYRLIYYKIEELKGGYSTELHNSEDVSFPESGYTALKNYYLQEKNRFLGRLLEHPYLTSLEYEDDITDHIEKLRNKYRSPDNLSYINEREKLEKNYAAIVIDSKKQEAGVSPEEIIDQFYAAKYNTLFDELEQINSLGLKVRPDLLDELIDNYHLFKNYKTEKDLLELLNKFFTRPIQEDYESNFHFDAGLVSGFVSSNDEFPFKLDGYSPEFKAGNGKPEAMLVFTLGGKIPLRLKKGIGSYLDISLSAGYVIKSEHYSDFDNYTFARNEGTDKLNDVYLFDGSELNNPRTSIFHLEINTPLIFMGELVIIEAGVLGAYYDYTYEIDGRLWYYTIVNNVSHKNDIKQDISGDYSFSKFKFSPTVNFLIVFMPQFNLSAKVNYYHSTISLRYNLPY
ncbi:MAG: hypothetical protein SCALA702_03920 [Melioribacteraceae bacterium]|nr:MAG: hypothetical protein SCALA702_03920 [Melioribacteraceae bacterium]